MDTSQPTLANFLQHLRTENQPFILRRDGSPPQWSDEALHRYNYDQNPELYALLAVAQTVQPWQRVRILFQLLQRSRKGMSNEIRCTLERVTDLLVAVLHPDQVLTVFLALRRVRANHKHTTRAILKYILNHPHFEDMVSSRRPTLVDCLEHALGKNVARACAKMLSGEATADETYLRRNLLRFVRDSQWVKFVVPFLYKQGTRQTSNGQYQQAHRQYIEKLEQQQERPKTVTATNRGDIAATLVHLYRGGNSTQLQQALDGYVEQAASELPRFEGKLALVLDASASTRSYGDREYCILAQSVALQRVLEKRCPNLQVHTVGGSGYPPMPEGNTDLATTLLDALESQPDLVAIVSDGYENVYPGDLERVVESLPDAGVQTPVVFCHSKFTNQDDLTLRRPAKNLSQLEFWHQNDFEDLLLSLFLIASGTSECLREFLLKKLYKVERVLELKG
ncbi:MAG TPA: hypothetical protein DCE56_09660 [Cyanobacteria bacterium UBA8553]|nr:hypothetical protein [Cyanobacteria bacterium UBA8553]